MSPPELDDISNVDIRSVIETCIGEHLTRPSLQELQELDVWKVNETLDKFPISMAVVEGGSLARTKKSMGSTKAESVRSVKKISDCVERVEKEH